MSLSIQRANHGFSLVELSIVLVILGLLVGGVLSGQSLIRAAEIRSVSSQYSRYIAAVQSFRDKYFALPGDMTNATAFWGAADGSTGLTATCKTTVSSTATTCNGNGDGNITSTPAYSYEIFRFWQHLANAGLIEGTYSGTVDSNSSASSVNVPVGKISSSIWNVIYVGNPTGNLSYFDGSYGNVLQFGTVNTTAGYYAYSPVFKPEEAWNLDTKLDDGMPATGKVVARDVSGFTGTNCTTATSSAVLTSTYYLPQTAIRCTMMFRQAF